MVSSSGLSALVQLYNNASPTSVTDISNAPIEEALFVLGQNVQGQVAGQLNNGRFAVLVNNQLLDLNLPPETQAGDTVALTVMSKDPRLTFALNSQTPGQTQSQGQAAPTPGRTANDAQLSNASRYLNDLLTPGDKGKSAQAQSLIHSEPLFSGPPDTAHLAEKLGQRLAQSGLFYESHQAEWVTGQRSLQELQREPQATLPTASQAKEVPQASPAKMEVASQALKLAADVTTKTAATQGTVASTQTDAHALDPQSILRNLVQQQMDVIEQRPIIWQGQAWPGQPMQWQLQAENEREGGGIEETEAQRWNTTLTLDLPNLGKVSVNASLSQGQFNLQFHAANKEAAAALKQAQPQLFQQFFNAGLLLGNTKFDDGLGGAVGVSTGDAMPVAGPDAA